MTKGEKRDKSREWRLKNPSYFRNWLAKHPGYYNNWRAKLKRMFGAKCILCGYDRCLRAIDFHHIDPKTKSFTISSNNHTWAERLEEAKKCVLLCRNCHAEVEEGLIDLTMALLCLDTISE